MTCAVCVRVYVCVFFLCVCVFVFVLVLVLVPSCLGVPVFVYSFVQHIPPPPALVDPRCNEVCTPR